MAAGEVTGATLSELQTREGKYYNSPLYLNHGIPYDVAYCLTKIGKQPDDYDGEQRFCTKRASKRDEDDYEGGKYVEDAYAVSCRFHGGDIQGKDPEGLGNPYTIGIKHGAYADDDNLIMDFNESEQALFDEIMEDWPEIYEWPPRSEDPARYRILRRVAVNEVRSIREEDYLDDHEVHHEPIYDDQGNQVGSKEVENPLAREYRLLMSEITDQMRELGLTPKERQKMDTLSSEADRANALSDVARDALNSEEGEYDPNQFDE